MAVDFEYACNYWRKTFESMSEGKFDKQDFDEWFRRSAKFASDNVGYYATVDEPGSTEHFDIVMRMALSEMLQACAKGRFGE